MILKTQRLILRKPEIKDVSDLIEGIGEFDVGKMLLNIPHPYKKKDAIDYINRSTIRWNDKKRVDYPFFIVLKSTKKVIGGIGVHKVNKFEKTATTGSWINKKYWKQGFITEAKIAINDLAFNKLKVEKLRTEVYKENVASNATQKKVGYKVEGFQLKARTSLTSGKTHDIIFYGLTKKDWMKVRPDLVKGLNTKIEAMK
jgi:ribosomal-protein-alanine N-acetyltransferase